MRNTFAPATILADILTISAAQLPAGETPTFKVFHAGAAASMPVSVPFTPPEGTATDRLAVAEMVENAAVLPAQFSEGRLWWMLPPGDKGERSFRLVHLDSPPDTAFRWIIDQEHQTYALQEGGSPIVRETLLLRFFPTTGGQRSRTMDVDVTLVALEDGVAIGGRPGAGYGGLTYRALPATNQEIAPFVADESVQPRAAWCHYSADFPGSRGRSSFVLFQHRENPGYPSPHNLYANINCFMPAFPGDREYPVRKGTALLLKHRVWIAAGTPSQEDLQKTWDAYNPH